LRAVNTPVIQEPPGVLIEKNACKYLLQIRKILILSEVLSKQIQVKIS